MARGLFGGGKENFDKNTLKKKKVWQIQFTKYTFEKQGLTVLLTGGPSGTEGPRIVWGWRRRRGSEALWPTFTYFCQGFHYYIFIQDAWGPIFKVLILQYWWPLPPLKKSYYALPVPIIDYARSSVVSHHILSDGEGPKYQNIMLADGAPFHISSSQMGEATFIFV